MPAPQRNLPVRFPPSSFGCATEPNSLLGGLPNAITRPARKEEASTRLVGWQ